MLGRFESFPKVVHKVAVFNLQDPKTKVQQAILSTFQGLNQQSFELQKLLAYLKQDIQVSFEVGVGDGPEFQFLQKKMQKKYSKAVEEDEFKVLDFFVVVRYHKLNNKGKQIPLRFDYHVMRFVFHEKLIELLIRHERGTQRIPIDDLIEFLTSQINKELKKRQLFPFG